MDNYSTHKHEQVKWLAKHPRFHFHFIPKSRRAWFRELTLRRGVFRRTRGRHPRVPGSEQPSGQALWTVILAKVERGCPELVALH